MDVPSVRVPKLHEETLEMVLRGSLGADDVRCDQQQRMLFAVRQPAGFRVNSVDRRGDGIAPCEVVSHHAESCLIVEPCAAKPYRNFPGISDPRNLLVDVSVGIDEGVEEAKDLIDLAF